MYCRNCGKEIEEQATVCACCGYPVGEVYYTVSYVQYVPQMPMMPSPMSMTTYSLPHAAQQPTTMPTYSAPIAPQPQISAPTYATPTAMQQPMVAPQNAKTGKVGTKSKLTAGLLGIFLGSFGVHNFYLGYTGKAIAQILLSLCTMGIGSLWGLIEGIMILCGKIDRDAEGNLLQD